MSADIWLVHPQCKCCGRGREEDESLNITYNLSPMLHEAGFAGWKWCEGKSARVVGGHMLILLNAMAKEPERWRAMNPENDWGDYDECLQGRMRAWAEKAYKMPAAVKVGTYL